MGPIWTRAHTNVPRRDTREMPSCLRKIHGKGLVPRALRQCENTQERPKQQHFNMSGIRCQQILACRVLRKQAQLALPPNLGCCATAPMARDGITRNTTSTCGGPELKTDS